MNIFKILSRGDGTIQEPNITSVLSYLLDPYADHGMGAIFLKEFLELIKPSDNDAIANIIKKIKSDAFNHNSEVDVNIEVERKIYKEDQSNKIGNGRDLDIVIEIYKSEELLLRTIIEIKINKGAFNESQLQDILNFTNDTNQFSNFENNSCNHYVLLKTSDFDTPKIVIPEKFKLIDWHKDSTESIYTIFSSIIDDEHFGKIDPLNNQLKDLIKSFMIFIASGFKDKDFYYPDITKVSVKIQGYELIYPQNNSLFQFLFEILSKLFEGETDIENVMKKLIPMREDKALKYFLMTTDEFNIIKLSGKNGKQIKDTIRRYKAWSINEIKDIGINPENLEDSKVYDNISITNNNVLILSNQWGATGKNTNFRPLLVLLKKTFKNEINIVITEEVVFGPTTEDNYTNEITL